MPSNATLNLQGDPFYIEAPQAGGGLLDCNEDLKEYPLRQALALWLILELTWDKKTSITKNTAELLGSIGVLETLGSTKVTIHPDVTTFLSESLKAAAKRALPYAQNPRLKSSLLTRQHHEDLSRLAEVKASSSTLFGEPTQYLWTSVVKDESTLLTLYKVARFASLMSTAAFSRRIEICRFFASQVIKAEKSRAEEDKWRQKFSTIAREVSVKYLSPELCDNAFIAENRAYILNLVGLVAKGLLIFDHKYTASERSLIHLVFQRFSVTQVEALDFKKICAEPLEQVLSKIPEKFHFGTYVFLLACLISDQKLSPPEHEFFISLGRFLKLTDSEKNQIWFLCKQETDSDLDLSKNIGVTI